MKKRENDVNLTLLFDNQRIELKSGFVGGVLAGEFEAPIGMYSGGEDFDEISIALMQMLRAVIKMYIEDQNLSYEQVRKIITFTTIEALETEMNPNPNDNLSLKKHQDIVLKLKREGRN